MPPGRSDRGAARGWHAIGGADRDLHAKWTTKRPGSTRTARARPVGQVGERERGPLRGALVEQHRHGPSVKDDVVQREHEEIVAGVQPVQCRAH